MFSATRARQLLTVCFALGTCGTALRAATEGASEGNPSPYTIDSAYDGTVIAGGAAFWLGSQVAMPKLVHPSCPCSVGSVNRFDRSYAGRRDDNVDRASTALLGVLLAAPPALEAMDTQAFGSGGQGFHTDMVILTEAVVTNGALNQLAKLAVQRPRPMVYGASAGDPILQQADSYTSFYSGHTSTAFAAALTYARTFALRHPAAATRTYVYTAAIAGAVAVGAMRVAAGRHFPTDVLVGAAAGSVTAYSVTTQHLKAAAKFGRLGIEPVAGGAQLVWRRVTGQMQSR